MEEFWYDKNGNTTEIAVDGVTVKTIQRSPDGYTELITDEKENGIKKTYDEYLKSSIFGDDDS